MKALLAALAIIFAATSAAPILTGCASVRDGGYDGGGGGD